MASALNEKQASPQLGIRSGSSSPQMAGLLNEKEAAAQLGIEAGTLTRWRWARKGPAYKKIGSLVRYAPSDLETYVSSVTVTP